MIQTCARDTEHFTTTKQSLSNSKDLIEVLSPLLPTGMDSTYVSLSPGILMGSSTQLTLIMETMSGDRPLLTEAEM